jgi:hypothetical protein
MFETSEIATAESAKQEFPNYDLDVAYRLFGIREIFSRVSNAAYAVAIGERTNDGNRYLWLFRNNERPIHLLDLRTTLGQIFFCSTEDILRWAILNSPSIKQYINTDFKIIEFPDPSKEDGPQVWRIGFDGVNNWDIRKFKITKVGPCEDKDEKSIPRVSKKPTVKIISRLNQNDELPANLQETTIEPQKQVEESKTCESKKKVEEMDAVIETDAIPTETLTKSSTEMSHSLVTVNQVSETSSPNLETNLVVLPNVPPKIPEANSVKKIRQIDDTKAKEDDDNINLKELDSIVKNIHEKIGQIETDLYNLFRESSLPKSSIPTIVDYLVSALDDLKSTYNFINQK